MTDPGPLPSLADIEAAALAPPGDPRRSTGAEVYERMVALGARNRPARMAARERLRRAEQQRDAQLRHTNLRRSLGWITERFYDFAPASLGDEEQVTAWAADAVSGASTDWLLLLGPTGVGKTWQAVAAYRAVCEDLGCEGYAIGVPEMIERTLPRAPDPLSLRPLEEADLLLLDDLDRGLTDYGLSQLFRVINARDSHAGRRTIVTSNLRREELRPALGDRLASRLGHRLRMVAMDGPDRRRPPPGGGEPLPQLPLR